MLIDAARNGDETVLNFREFQGEKSRICCSITVGQLLTLLYNTGTLNDGKSAFCAFRFEQSFFDSVRYEELGEPEAMSTPMAAALPLPALAKLLRGDVV